MEDDKSLQDEFIKWEKANKDVLAAAADGPFYVGKYLPFPCNPSFRPRPVLSNEYREKIYRKFTQDPSRESLTRLAITNNLDICKLEAIIRQKKYEKTLEGLDASSYVINMERNILVSRSKLPLESRNTGPNDPKGKLLVAAPENYTFSVTDVYYSNFTGAWF
jgi:hypothetical protein